MANRPSDIAIIGIGSLFPGSRFPEVFWDNILRKEEPISEIPPERWDWRLYFDPDRNAKDKIYSKWGGFFGEVPFDPLRYGIPPTSLRNIEPTQLITLEVVRWALEDAGYGEREFDRENTSVILGETVSHGQLGIAYNVRGELANYVELPSSDVWDRLPEWTEESFAGLLLNVLAGRVANRFDLGGMNQTVDAACASSLAAVNLAIHELHSGDSNLVITGGVDTTQSSFSYLCFSKTHALSPQGVTRAFDKEADGIVISEGIGIVVLRRLEDALKDGDRIYAVIKGVGSSSDGKAKSLYAPFPAGQRRALRRAYNKAGFTPDTLGLIEAHGTGTAAGDRAEVETIIHALEEHRALPKSCVIGSVKSQIGHTKGAAGVASLIKTALALYHKVLPPHNNVENPQDPIADINSPVYLLKEPRPWIAHPDHPRRAGASAFGFGGTNFHVVLEELEDESRQGVAGGERWPEELIVMRASDPETLLKDVRSLLGALQAGAQPQLRDLAYSMILKAEAEKELPVSLAMVIHDLAQLEKTLKNVIPHIKGEATYPLELNVRYETFPVAKGRKIAFMFPGHGSQYPGMLSEAAMYFPEVRQAFEYSDRITRGEFPKPLSAFIFPPSPFTLEEDERNYEHFRDTHIGQPALDAVFSGLIDLADRLILKPDMVGGHSFGEPAALHYAGALSREEFIRLGLERSRIMAYTDEARAGTMAALKLSRDEVLKRIEGVEGVELANINGQLQSVIAGVKEKVVEITEQVRSEEINVSYIPVIGAFHSSLFNPQIEPLRELFAAAEIRSPELPLYCNSSGGMYPTDPDGIRNELATHLMMPVEFLRMVRKMYDDGARVFVELGPKAVVSHLVEQILENEEVTVVSFDGEGGGMNGLLRALATLTTRGVDFKLSALFEGRNVRQLELERLVETTSPEPLSKTTWLINGGNARPHTEEIGYLGKKPLLSVDTLPEAREKFISEITGGKVTAETVKAESDQPGDGRNQDITAPEPVPLPEGTDSYEALMAYQESMRRFLESQEKAMERFLKR